MPDFKDRRAVERFPVNADSGCDFVSPVLEDFGPAKIKNISTDGIGLLMSHHLKPGLLLTINVVNRSKPFAKTMLVRVMHVTPETTGVFLVGGKFVTPLTYQELCTLVMETGPTPSTPFVPFTAPAPG